jgi:long-chain acyl-CoA synthetase
MLYERWQQIARESPSEVALRDLASGCSWTFDQLASAADLSSGDPKRVVFPSGNGPEFVLAVLRAWKVNAVVCPLEAGQPAPAMENAPAGCVHFKLTSATSGSARLVAFRPEQLMADARNIVETMGLRREWPNLGVISLSHSYGFSNLILPLLLHGIPLVLSPSPLPEIVRRQIAELTNVTLAAVPALWRTWLDSAVLSDRIRLAISAGAPLPVALEQTAFKESGLKIHNFYGSSECGGIAYDNTATPRSDPAMAGVPMKNVRVAPGDAGCLEVRSDAVGQTYWPEAGPALGNGVFRTSDIGEILGETIYLRGRATDLINVAGRKLAPESVERALLQHAGVAEVLVFGVPDDDSQRGDLIVACVVPRNKTTASDLREFLLNSLPAWQVPREWWFVESLQANQRGKISRLEWRRRFIAEQRKG